MYTLIDWTTGNTHTYKSKKTCENALNYITYVLGHEAMMGVFTEKGKKIFGIA